MSPIASVPQSGRSRHLDFSRSSSPALSDDDLDAITPATEADTAPLPATTTASPFIPQLESCIIPFAHGSSPELELDYLYRRYSMLGGGGEDHSSHGGLGGICYHHHHQGTPEAATRRISSSSSDEECCTPSAEKRRPSFDPAEGQDIDNEHLWLRMLAIQRRFHCYNSARMSAALEDDAVKAIVPPRVCLDLLNESISQLPDEARRILDDFIRHGDWNGPKRKRSWRRGSR